MSETQPELTDSDATWQRLSGRVIVVDFARTVITLLPSLIAVFVVGIDLSSSAMWPLIALAAWGVLGAIADTIRWIVTRYRVTPSEIELRTGLFVRRNRSVRRDRIRSVDTHAQLRHRLAGLRVVTIGAGQQVTAGEPAFFLDALTKADASALREELLHSSPVAVSSDEHAESRTTPDEAGIGPIDAVEPLAAFRPWWFVYNTFSIWVYLSAFGVLGAATWFASSFGLDLVGFSTQLIDWGALTWWQIALIVIVGGGLIGAVISVVTFFTGFWRFTLDRVRTADASYLRTRRGLFSTHEVNRDEARLRGLSISEPVFWRWMRMTDTNVITTGLGIWSSSQPTTILPRGPRSVALEVSRDVLGEPCPIDTAFGRHPRMALRRRLWWATLAPLVAAATLIAPIVTGLVPAWSLWIVAASWVITILGAFVAYRALGHTISGRWLVVRAGLMSRTTSALRRDAVSTIAIRQSLLQRRLGLATVGAMTAAGWGVYEAPDLAADEAVAFAADAAPGLLDEFRVAASAQPTSNR